MSNAATAKLPRRAAEVITKRVEDLVGGPARSRVVIVFACVLALESADLATVGAAAPQLEAAFHISNAGLGLLAAISTMVGALATVPVGVLTDRVNRVKLLAAAVALWGVAMVASAAAQGFGWLLLSRVGLGAVTAAAGPTIASLTGDFFPAAERGKIYGYVLSGELIGVGVGFVISGSLAGALSWRWAFGILVVPAAVLALVIWRRLPEPARGGQSRLSPGAQHIVGAHAADGRSATGDQGQSATGPADGDDGLARRAILQDNVRPVRAHVLRRDPRTLGVMQAIRYVLSVSTNRWLIVASAIGYFFFAGLRTFALVFARGHLDLSQSAATAVLFLAGLGSLAGVLLAGRLADRLIRRGSLTGRVLVGAIAYIAAAVILLPALLAQSLVLAIPLLVVAAAALSAPNPPLDAARLDIMPSRLWGRAEGVRTLLRQTAQAGAPLLFGALADAFGGSSASASQGHVSAASTQGLQYAFLIMLLPLLINGLMLLGARRRYPADVATAVASEDAKGGRD